MTQFSPFKSMTKKHTNVSNFWDTIQLFFVQDLANNMEFQSWVSFPYVPQKSHCGTCHIIVQTFLKVVNSSKIIRSQSKAEFILGTPAFPYPCFLYLFSKLNAKPFCYCKSNFPCRHRIENMMHGGLDNSRFKTFQEISAHTNEDHCSHVSRLVSQTCLLHII